MTKPDPIPTTPLLDTVASPASPADGRWLEGPLPVAPPGETYEQWLDRRAEMMGRLARDENLRRHFAKWLS